MPVTCPRCGVNEYTPYAIRTSVRLDADAPPFPALSRADNKTYICSPCGTDEAMRDFSGEPPVPPSEWPIEKVVA